MVFLGGPRQVGKTTLAKELLSSEASYYNWDEAENRHAIFRLSPFGSPKIKAVKKEQKHYHFDWTLIEDESFRFRNLV